MKSRVALASLKGYVTQVFSGTCPYICPKHKKNYEAFNINCSSFWSKIRHEKFSEFYENEANERNERAWHTAQRNSNSKRNHSKFAEFIFNLHQQKKNKEEKGRDRNGKTEVGKSRVRS